MNPTIGRIVLYRTDGRNGLAYDLPAIITVTRDTHPGDYPTGEKNPLPVPESDMHVHLTVFTPGGFGTSVIKAGEARPPYSSSEFQDAEGFIPGSGSYVEWNVPAADGDRLLPRTWRWPVIR